MENQKNNNKGIIILMIIIIVILSILCILFVTGAINLTNNKENNIITNTTNIIDNNNNSKYENEINIVKNIFSNSTVQYLVDNVSVLYCQTEGNIIDEKELGLNYDWNGYYKCSNFNSYEEIINHFKQYITDDFYNNTISQKPYIKQSTILSNGVTMYNYYEKNGKLYAAMTGKGSNMEKCNFLEDDSNYIIESADNEKISATIDAKWKTCYETENSETVKITLKKNLNNIWKVDSYETT